MAKVKTKIIAIAGLVLFTANMAGAESIFKQTTPDGRTIYTDSPSKNLKTEKKIKVDEHRSGIWNDRKHIPTPKIEKNQKSINLNSEIGSPGTPIDMKLPLLPGSTGYKAQQEYNDAAKENEKALKQRAKEDAKATEDARAKSIEDAEARLLEARKAQETGKDLIEGDRIGTVNKTSRLTPQYIERQEKLQKDVIEAEKGLDSIKNN